VSNGRCYFKATPDHRQAGKAIYPLDGIVLLRLLAVLAGAAGALTDIARFGETKLDLLRRFRPLKDGAPAHDHLGDNWPGVTGVPRLG
jgi:hypothetical protein